MVLKQFYLKFLVAPKWSEEPQNTSLLLGRNGHISCRANGYPQPQTHWLKKDGKFNYKYNIFLEQITTKTVVAQKCDCL